jgi:hypothetical protein
MKATAAAAVLVAALCVAPSARAQWARVHDRVVPRGAGGEPNLTAPAPKAADGRPDLSGVWADDTEPLPPGVQTVEGDAPFPRYLFSIAADLKPEDVPFQPWAAELFQQRLRNNGADGPTANCKPSGVPAVDSTPLPFKIAQTPAAVYVLYEENTVFRQIFLDGRKPIEDAVPRWLGYSTGKWNGDTLVVDTVGFNERHWLDGMGHPNSDKLHVVERIRRRDVGHLEIGITIDDPGAYTKPITYTVKATLVPDGDLLEYFCAENEKDVQHFH